MGLGLGGASQSQSHPRVRQAEAVALIEATTIYRRFVLAKITRLHSRYDALHGDQRRTVRKTVELISAAIGRHDFPKANRHLDGAFSLLPAD